ncbi:MAG TPA: TIGR03435 family protein, partial [Bryobacteraceae bacterium]|nr:TIGR03435 family protein [Bryobacteraceae bacterium]
PRVPPAMGASITLMDAIEKQLGLKLDPIKVPLPVIMVDAVNQKPTDNLADIKKRLGEPEAPTEFEVADVKPTNPDFKRMGIQIQPGGRVNIAGATLKFLIEQAWNVTDEMLIGAPKWLEADRFDIVAKVSTTAGPGAGPQIDIDTLWTMLQSLIKDRFKLAAHMEERPVNAYTLVAVKPKLKKADPTSRTRFTEGPGADGKDPREKNPMLSRLVTCQNMTMAQFAEKLQSIAPGYIHTPVLDSTGLEGSWDFTLSFSAAGLDRIAANAGRGGGGPGNEGGGRGGESAGQISNNAPQASDPSGSVSLFEAIEKQLGLKLEKQKRNAQVLVIDHIEQKPTDN